MQKNTHGNRRGSKQLFIARTIFIDVNGDGKKVSTSISALANSDRTRFHGIVDGRQVNSIVGIKHGASMVLSNGKGGTMAATDDELTVFATKFLADKGHTVQLKSGASVTTS